LLRDDAIFLAISSVRGREGLAYDLWSKHFGKDDDSTLMIYGPSRACICFSGCRSPRS
jgi:hypothetical protein